MESYSAAEDNVLDAYVFILSTGSHTLSACLICLLKKRKKKKSMNNLRPTYVISRNMHDHQRKSLFVV